MARVTIETQNDMAAYINDTEGDICTATKGVQRRSWSRLWHAMIISAPLTLRNTHWFDAEEQLVA